MQGADTAERLYSSGLEKLTPGLVQNQKIKRFTEQYRWPLGIAILLLLIERILPEVKRLKQKNSNSIKQRTAAILLFLSISSLINASSNEALSHMQNRDFSKALEVYEEILLENENDDASKARLQYNAGTAAYNAKDYLKAEEYFRKALNQTEAPLSLQQRAFYNLGNSKFRLGETTQNPDEKIKQWTEALKQFQGAHNLSQQLDESTEDKDALFNSELVKKRLKQLEQQQQQQGNKDQQDQEQKEQNSEENKDQQDQEQKKQSKPKQSQDQPDTGQIKKDGKMTQEQVERLLDSLKQQEKSLIYRPSEKSRSKKRGKIRDW